MSKEHYYEICEALGSEPIEEEIPIEQDDLPEIVVNTLAIYESLIDEWEYMGGNYVGKNLQNLFQVLDLYDIPNYERLLVYKLICIIDAERRDIIREKQASSTPKT